MGWLRELLDGNSDQTGTGKVDQAEKKIAEIEAENHSLKDENQRLKADIDKLKAAQGASATPWIEASGVLWRRKPSGGVESVPYCPTCKSLLSDYAGSLLCMKCNWPAPLKSFEVPRVYHDMFGGEGQ